MEWSEIETFLTKTIWGILILNVIAGALLFVLLKLVGRTNKGIKWFWLYYKEGRKQIIIGFVNSSILFEKFKYKIIIQTLIYSIFSIIGFGLFLVSTLGSKSYDASDYIYLTFLSISWIYLCFAYKIIYLTFDELIRLKKSK